MQVTLQQQPLSSSKPNQHTLGKVLCTFKMNAVHRTTSTQTCSAFQKANTHLPHLFPTQNTSTTPRHGRSLSFPARCLKYLSPPTTLLEHLLCSTGRMEPSSLHSCPKHCSSQPSTDQWRPSVRGNHGLSHVPFAMVKAIFAIQCRTRVKTWH